MESFVVYVSSEQSSALYPRNVPGDFTVHLNRPYHLKGEWECALIQLSFEGQSGPGYYLCCDLVAESFVGRDMLPVLRRVRDKTWQFRTAIYVPLKTHDFESVRIFLRTWNNRDTRLVRPIYVTLHFRRRPV